MRSFVAVPIPPALSGRLGSLLEDLRAKLPAASWLKPDSIHLTIAFLGDQDGRTVPRINGALSAAVLPIRGFAARASRFGVFPDERRARVGWIGLEPGPPFHELADGVREALASESITFEAKPFVPHLTVVRMRTAWNRSEVSRFLGSPLPGDLLFDVSRVVLYRSVLSPSGAVHSEEGSFPLQTDANLASPRGLI